MSFSPDRNPWNRDVPFSHEEIWLGASWCLERISRKIAGENIQWLEYVWRRYISPASSRCADPRTLRCLILGSNEGWIELHLCQNGFTGEIIASDIADKAIDRARQKVRNAGYNNVRHVVADLNTDSFEGDFDFVICEGVLHHIEQLERCLGMLRSHLRPGGMIFAIEFEGPVRFQLPDLQVRWINAALHILPKSLRPLPEDAELQFPASESENRSIHYSPPSPESIFDFDPTEACNGPELKRLLPLMFEVVERTGFGGTLLSYIAAHFDFKRTNTDDFARKWLEILCRIEDTLIESGILQDDFVFYVLKKQGNPVD